MPTNLISWLIAYWGNLISLASTNFNNLVSLAKSGIQSTVSWVKSQLRTLGNTVNSNWYWVQGKASSLWNDIISYYNAAKSYAVGLYNSAISWVNTQYNAAINYAAGVYTNAKNWADAAVSTVRSWASTQLANLSNSIGAARTDATNWFNQAKSDAKAGLDSIKGFFQGQIDALTALFNTQNKTQSDRTSWIESQLSLGFMGMVWGVIEAYIFPWVCWWLASLMYNGSGNLPSKPAQPGSGGPTPGIPFPVIPGGAPSFKWPVSGRYVSGYTFGLTHKGVDLGISNRDPIMAAAAGVVVAAGWSTVGYGNMVDLAHADGWKSRYAHFAQVMVLPGQSVSQGQVIGLGDSTGNSTGPHLHLEISQNGKFYDPLTLLS